MHIIIIPAGTFNSDSTGSAQHLLGRSAETKLVGLDLPPIHIINQNMNFIGIMQVDTEHAEYVSIICNVYITCQNMVV